jgi:methionine sulfoxide reductase heme-binding subunit
MSNTSIVATATGPHLFWITSRAAGVAALLLSSVSVCAGLLMGGRISVLPASLRSSARDRERDRDRSADTRVTHEALSLATLAAIAIHAVSLLGDHYMHPSIADVALPFVSGYRTFWTSAGIVAFWTLAILGLSYYARTRIGVQRWRRLHRYAALAWLLGVIHALGEGTDAGQTWFLVMTAIAVVPALALLVYRHAAPALGGRTAAGAR